MCISWTIKVLISLMHGITMKMSINSLNKGQNQEGRNRDKEARWKTKNNEKYKGKIEVTPCNLTVGICLMKELISQPVTYLVCYLVSYLFLGKYERLRPEASFYERSRHSVICFPLKNLQNYLTDTLSRMTRCLSLIHQGTRKSCSR